MQFQCAKLCITSTRIESTGETDELITENGVKIY